ncbi:MAG TPA: pyridoxal-phosphate dependent enzyme [Cytophagaceae bacterium]
MSLNFILPSPFQKLEDKLLDKYEVTLFVKRDDLIHPIVSGNKWRKLKYNLEEVRRQNKDTILTFGGAYSNHIHATAAACKLSGLRSIGVIRGEKQEVLNPTLAYATEAGMYLEYMDRQTYRNKETEAVLQGLKDKFRDVFIIPEGGGNVLGAKGCKEIVAEIPEDFDYICCACGTGTTLAGITASLTGNQTAVGFSSLKGGDFLKGQVLKLLGELNSTNTQFELITNYHFGGYGKIKRELVEFIDAFQQRTQVPLEPVYTGKMIFGIYDLLEKGYFKQGARIVIVHTGGLQGNDGMKIKMEKLKGNPF